MHDRDIQNIVKYYLNNHLYILMVKIRKKIYSQN